MICEDVLERLRGCAEGNLLPDAEMASDAAEVIELLLGMEEAMRERIVPKELCRLALDTYGADAQTLMLFEEMAELQNALCKLERGRGHVSAVAEEIADVQIMLEQMTILHGCASSVDNARAFKLIRLRKRLEEHHGT